MLGKNACVVEIKVVDDPEEIRRYHANDDALLAQIFTSLIGSEAPFSVIVCNDLFKIIWTEDQCDGTTHFHTYPHGNNFGDLRDPTQSAVFCQTMFHAVRCSLVKVIEDRKPKKARTTTVDETVKKEGFEPGYLSQRAKPGTKPNIFGGSGLPKSYKRGVALDGSLSFFLHRSTSEIGVKKTWISSIEIWNGRRSMIVISLKR
jgi:hypothetical protein